MTTIEAVVAVVGGFGQAVPVLAADSGTIQLKSNSKVEPSQVSYSCGNQDMLTVTYVNASANFVAIVPLPKEPQPIVFVSVVSDFGARYASGKFIWWTKGKGQPLRHDARRECVCRHDVHREALRLAINGSDDALGCRRAYRLHAAPKSRKPKLLPKPSDPL